MYAYKPGAGRPLVVLGIMGTSALDCWLDQSRSHTDDSESFANIDSSKGHR